MRDLDDIGPCLWPDWCGASDLCANCGEGGVAHGECPHGHTDTGCAACGYEPPTNWDLYSTVADCQLQEWSDRANERGLCARDFLGAMYAHPKQLDLLAMAESPFMRMAARSFSAADFFDPLDPIRR